MQYLARRDRAAASRGFCGRFLDGLELGGLLAGRAEQHLPQALDDVVSDALGVGRLLRARRARRGSRSVRGGRGRRRGGPGPSQRRGPCRRQGRPGAGR